MQEFFKLRADKQNHIIDAALAVFGRSGYRKASVNDIAEAAGISKAMIFYYFGSKRNLYIYLRDLCMKTVSGAVEKGFEERPSDFFDRLTLATVTKMSVLKEHPAMLTFIKSYYSEPDPEVADSIRKHVTDSGSLANKLMFEKLDFSKFKDDVDPKLLFRFLIWTGEGFANELSVDASAEDIDRHLETYYKVIDMMRRHFYKDEY